MPRYSRSGLLMLGALCAIAGCSSSARYSGNSHNPLSDMHNQELTTPARVAAVDAAWADGESGQTERSIVRDNLKQLIWKAGAPGPARLRALEHLLADQTPEGRADTLNMLRLRLPTETHWPMLAAISEAVQGHASDPAWRDLTAPLVRSYARRVPVPPDPDRPERDALLALHPGRELEAIVLDVYLRPAENGAAGSADLVEKAREAAWELLGRLDPDGSRRAALLADAPADSPALALLTRTARELGVVPITGSELNWVRGLAESTDEADRGWWRRVSEAVVALEPAQRAGLQLRHLEPLRWAADRRPELLEADLASLRGEVESRLQGRRIWRRTEGLGQDQMQSPETLREWGKELVWGDYLAIIVIDESLNSAGLIKELLDQAAADRLDTSTEHGGVLLAQTEGEPVVRSYPPRPAQRVNDRTFVASEEMFKNSGRSLAHYHFHAQKVGNADYAGPGRGDVEYATTHGRSCLVLTPVREGVLNVDYYARGRTPEAVPVIDLGELRLDR